MLTATVTQLDDVFLIEVSIVDDDGAWLGSSREAVARPGTPGFDGQDPADLAVKRATYATLGEPALAPVIDAIDARLALGRSTT